MAKRLRQVPQGEYLKELLAQFSLSQYGLARSLGVSPMSVHHIMHGRCPVTAELAMRLGRYFCLSPCYWLNLQSRYDMDVAEETLGA